MIPFAQQTGVLEGGWTYIWAAYGLTWLAFGGYALSLVVRGRGRGGDAQGHQNGGEDR